MQVEEVVGGVVGGGDEEGGEGGEMVVVVRFVVSEGLGEELGLGDGVEAESVDVGCYFAWVTDEGRGRGFVGWWGRWGG